MATKRTRTRAQLLTLLGEARGFLAASAAAYDAGFEAEAKRLAVTMRTLLHDTKASHSLLDQLKVKDKLDYTDTADPINPANLLPTPGLLMMQLTSLGDGKSEARYMPRGMDGPIPHRPRPFPAWWTWPVVSLLQEGTWTRQQLVLSLANKEGGAHVDPSLDERYEHLVRENGLGWRHGSRDAVDEGEPLAGDPVAGCVRQIADELMDTLTKHEDLLR